MSQCIDREASRSRAPWSARHSPTTHPDEWALFVDVDAWLVARPHAAHTSISIRTLALLGALFDRLHGAVALLSARPIQDLDELLYPLRAPCAGLQGLERRDALGGEHRLRTDSRLAHVRSLPQAREVVSEMTLAAFLAEEPFRGRRPLWLGPNGLLPGIEHFLARRGGHCVPSRRRNHEPSEAPLDQVARHLLGDEAPLERALLAGAGWARPSTAQ
jgi:hypothetical protein